MKIRKTFDLIKLYFQRNFVFRLNFLFGWLTTIIRFLFIVIFWSAALKDSNADIGYTQNSLILYFFVIMIIGLCIQTDVAEKVSNAIYSGNLSTDLLKPVSFRLIHFTQGIAQKLLFLVIIIAISVVLIFIPNYSSLFAVSVIFSLLINFELNYIIGLMGFWTYTVWGIAMVNDVLVSVFGGKMFPLEIAPSFFAKISSFLPYKYIYYVPTLVLEEKLGIPSILMQGIYVLVLFVLSRIVYKCGLKKFEATGM